MKPLFSILSACAAVVLLVSCAAPASTGADDPSAPVSPVIPAPSSLSVPSAEPDGGAPATPAPTASPSPVESQVFDPVYFLQEFSRDTTRAVLEETFPGLREQLDPPQPGDPEDLILISEGWSYEGIPGVVLFTCDEGVQLRSASFHGYGADFKKALAMRDALQQQLEQAGLWEKISSGTLAVSEAIDLDNDAKWVPFSEDSDTLPPYYVISTVLNFSHPSTSLSWLYAGEEAAPRWYPHIYKATGELDVRTQADPATDFCISVSYLFP